MLSLSKSRLYSERVRIAISDDLSGLRLRILRPGDEPGQRTGVTGASRGWAAARGPARALGATPPPWGSRVGGALALPAPEPGAAPHPLGLPASASSRALWGCCLLRQRWRGEAQSQGRPQGWGGGQKPAQEPMVQGRRGHGEAGQSWDPGKGRGVLR